MFQEIQKTIETSLRQFCEDKGIPFVPLQWKPIPFAGEWGISTSFFQIAAEEARAGRGSGKPVPQRAQELAEQAAGQIAAPGISRA